jgi:hypothetical protein
MILYQYNMNTFYERSVYFMRDNIVYVDFKAKKITNKNMSILSLMEKIKSMFIKTKTHKTVSFYDERKRIQ